MRSWEVIDPWTSLVGHWPLDDGLGELQWGWRGGWGGAR